MKIYYHDYFCLNFHPILFNCQQRTKKTFLFNLREKQFILEGGYYYAFQVFSKVLFHDGKEPGPVILNQDETWSTFRERQMNLLPRQPWAKRQTGGPTLASLIPFLFFNSTTLFFFLKTFPLLPSYLRRISFHLCLQPLFPFIFDPVIPVLTTAYL